MIEFILAVLFVLFCGWVTEKYLILKQKYENAILENDYLKYKLEEMAQKNADRDKMLQEYVDSCD